VLGTAGEALVREGQSASHCGQWRRQLRHALTCGEQFTELPGKAFKLIQRLRPARLKQIWPPW
jgi:hypothetical protein